VKTPEFIRITFCVMVLVSYTVFGANTANQEPLSDGNYDYDTRVTIVDFDSFKPVTSARMAEDYALRNMSDTVVAAAAGQPPHLKLSDNIGRQLLDENVENVNVIHSDVIYADPEEELAVPWLDSDFKAYMPYDSITDKSTPQWRYRKLAWTDYNGLRRVGNDYLVAMGTYYADEVGSRFKVTLDSGSEITVTVGDIKDPAHTDRYNMYTPVKNTSGKVINANVLEFLVDTEKLDKKAAKLGTVSCIDGLEGNVESIEKLT
jgi:hypothetical protein